MTKREVIHAVLDGAKPPYVPWSFSFTLEARKMLVQHFGSGDLEPVLQNHFLGLGIGLKCFNPFQPEVMEVATLIPHYRGRLAFPGGLSTQKTLPFGTADEVRTETRKLIALG